MELNVFRNYSVLEVLEMMNDIDKEVYDEAMSSKTLTKEGSKLYRAKLLKLYEENGSEEEINDIKAIFVENAKPLAARLSVSYMQTYGNVLNFSSVYFEAMEAVQKAAKRFLRMPEHKRVEKILKNKDVYASFNTYAYYQIMDKLGNVYAEFSNKNLTALKKEKHILNVVEDYISKYGAMPTYQYISEKTGLSQKTIENFYSIPVVEPKESEEVKTLKEHSYQKVLSALKDLLNEQEYQVIYYTMGFNGENLTQTDVAKKLKLSFYKVHQYYKSALDKLSQNKDFLTLLIEMKAL